MEISRFFIKLFTGSLLLFLINGPSLAAEPEYPLHSTLPYPSYDDEADQWDVSYDEIEQWGRPYGETGQWTLLGDNLVTQTEDLAGSTRLISDLMGRPILAFSTQDKTNNELQTHVARWSDEHMAWIDIGQPPIVLYPSLGIDNQQRIYLCGGKGPYVWRWNGSDWMSLGDDISTETGYRKKRGRYFVGSCDIALDNTNTPMITWRAMEGHNSFQSYAARWDELQQKWLPFGRSLIAGKGARVNNIAIDILNRPYLAASNFTSTRITRVGTSRFLRRDGNSWNQLGAEFSKTHNPFIAINKNRPYIALNEHINKNEPINENEPRIMQTERSKQIIRIMRWRKNEWEELPNPGLGYGPKLNFTLMGKLIMTYQSIDNTNKQSIHVKHFIDDAWQNLGDPVAQRTGSTWLRFDMTIDARGRPTVSWMEHNPTTNQTQLFVKRFQHSYD